VQDTSLIQNYDTIYSMPHTTEAFLEIWSSDGSSGSLIGTIPNKNIIELKTVRGLFNENDFSIGCCFAGEIDAKFFALDENDEEVEIPRMAMIKVFIQLRARDTNLVSGRLQKGEFFIDTRSIEKSSGALKIHGFDAMLKAENQYVDDGNTYIDPEIDPPDMNVVIQIAKAIGVFVDDRTSEVITGNSDIGTPIGYSMREILSGIGIPYCANWCISDKGELLAVSAIVTEPEYGLLVDNTSGAFITIGEENGEAVRIIV